MQININIDTDKIINDTKSVADNAVDSVLDFSLRDLEPVVDSITNTTLNDIGTGISDAFDTVCSWFGGEEEKPALPTPPPVQTKRLYPSPQERKNMTLDQKRQLLGLPPSSTKTKISW